MKESEKIRDSVSNNCHTVLSTIHSAVECMFSANAICQAEEITFRDMTRISLIHHEQVHRSTWHWKFK